MIVPGSVNPLLLRSAAATGYQVSRSLRFNSSDSAYCLRTPSSNGTSYTTWTWSTWVKRSAPGSQVLFSAGTNTNDYLIVNFEPGDTLRFVTGENGATNQNLVTTAAVFRDYSAWYHIVVQADFNNATQADRIKIYVNDTRQTISGTIATQGYTGTTFNRSGIAHNIGRQGNGTGYFSGYLADIYFIDGLALTPSSFTEVSATTGQLIPKAYTGSYGTNGFQLKFADNSNNTATTLGKDTSGNGNNWTPTNFSVTAGAGNDSVVDTPVSFGSDTGVGNEVRGNYCTLNPLSLGSGVALANGNLDVTLSTSNAGALGTIAMPSGKWYFEGTVGGTGNNVFIAIRNAANTQGYFYATSGLKADFSGAVAYGASSTTGDVLGVAFDNTAGTITFYKNGVSQGVAYSGISTTDTWFPYWYSNVAVSTTWSFNFGQRAFAYTAPSGFKALCDTNLPAPVVAKPSTAFGVVTYTGNGSARSITGLAFNPDLVWIKSRSAATDHELTDSVRGVTKSLSSNLTAAEATDTGGLTAFNSDGFSLGTDTKYNNNAATYAAWAWDAGSSTVTNTQGSITSSVRANASAGFSIVTYTAPSSGAWTVGHGLGVAPQFIITKSRSNAYQWGTYHVSVGNTGRLDLNSTGAVTTTQNSAWNNTSPTSTVFSVGSDWAGSGITYVAYCFAPVAGYSSFGSYTGNGSADGPFVYTGFRPRWVMIKVVNATGNGFLDAWLLYDSARDTYNVATKYLYANSSQAENSYAIPDFCSNGFKIRAGTTESNQNGNIYIYAAFAESPFAYSRAR